MSTLWDFLQAGLVPVLAAALVWAGICMTVVVVRVIAKRGSR